jgi:hypothetical protein
MNQAAADRFLAAGGRGGGVPQRFDALHRWRASSALAPRLASRRKSCTPRGPVGLNELTTFKYHHSKGTGRYADNDSTLLSGWATWPGPSFAGMVRSGNFADDALIGYDVDR